MFPRRKRAAHALVLIAALGGLPGAAIAQDQNPPLEFAGKALVVELAGHKVTFPAPAWAAEAEPGSPTRKSPFVFKVIEPGVEALTFVPPNENIVSWTRMMGVLAVNREGYGAALQVESMLAPIRAACVDGQLGITTVKPPRPGLTEGLILACGRYKPTGAGPRGCAAGFLVAVVRESWVGAVKVYDERCVGAFNLDDPGSWPVTPEELMKTALEMQGITAFEQLPG